MKRPIVIISLALLALGGFAWTTFPVHTVRPAGVQNSLRAVSLVLNGPLDAEHAGEVVALRAGLFKDNGLNFELKAGASGVDPIASVVNGSDTFGVVEGYRFLLAYSKGAPIVAFGAGYLETSVVFYSLAKSGISAPQDFIGKRVGRQPGTDKAIFFDALIKNAGFSRSSIRESTTEFDVEALLSDRIDVMPGHVGKEAFALYQKGIPYNVIRVSDYGIHVPNTVYFVSEKFIREHPSVVQRVLRAIIGGWNMVYADMSKVVPLLASADSKNITPEQVQFQLSAQHEFIKPIGRRVAEFDDLQWKQLRTILINARLLDDTLDLGRAVNYDVLKEVYRKPVSFGN